LSDNCFILPSVEISVKTLHLLPCLIDSCGWQDGVPETIELLKRAGINVWMITGDKQNTAIQIGLLCNLITSGKYFTRNLLSFKFPSHHVQQY
jgi:magnesium-transporting ATPase (P-type)